MVYKLLFLALAGALGTLARYAISGYVQKASGISFPIGTMAVNIIGCLIAGMLWAVFDSRFSGNTDTRTLILIGFTSAFTTFSAFILESGELARNAQWLHLSSNVFLQNFLGFASLYVGVLLGRLI